MSYVVRIRKEAEQDLAAAASWYEERRSGLGQEFLDEFMIVRERLSENPMLFPIVHRATHRAMTNRFPFGVYFRIEDAEVVILAVMHGSRDPRRWHERT